MTRTVTEHVDHAVDLVAFAGDDGWVFHRGGVGVAGRGPARRVAAPEADRVLGHLGGDVVAFGARPFAPEADWDLVIPAEQIRVDPDGTTRRTRIDDPATFTEAADRPDDGGAATGPIRIETVDDPEVWKQTVARATARIRAGRVDKVVLAREITATAASGTFSPSKLAHRLGQRFEACYVFSVDGLVGASPELLVERTDDIVRSQPMAGTARRCDDPGEDARLQAELFASPVYRLEHQLTIDMVHDTLLDFTSWLDFEPEPSIVTLANVAHLATRVEGRLTTPAASVLELQAALHPTPAVSGRPRDAAIELIGELEARDRGRYAGTVGWVDGAGNGTWAVAIRCAQIDPDDHRTARVHAGCGLVADSDPVRELAESEAKLRAILSVLED